MPAADLRESIQASLAEFAPLDLRNIINQHLAARPTAERKGAVS